jgi:hypothetical protein
MSGIRLLAMCYNHRATYNMQISLLTDSDGCSEGLDEAEGAVEGLSAFPFPALLPPALAPFPVLPTGTPFPPLVARPPCANDADADRS